MKKNACVLVIICLLLGQIFTIGFSQSQEEEKENLSLNAKSISIEATNLTGVSDVNPNSNPKNMIDGNKETSCQTYAQAQVGNFTITFNEPTSFNQVVITDIYRNLLKFTLESSNDGISFKPFYTYDKGIPLDTLYLAFPIQTTKFLKINVLKGGTRTETSYYGFCLSEIEVYNIKKGDFTRLNEQIKTTEEFLKVAKSNSQLYFKDRISKIDENLALAKEIKKNSNADYVEIENVTIALKDSIFSAKKNMNRTKEDYDKVIYNVKESILFTNTELDEQGQKNLQSDVATAEKLWKSMNKNGSSLLWSETGTIEDAILSNECDDISTMIVNLRKMSIAASSKYSKLKGNKELLKDIEYALKIIEKYWYGEDVSWFGANLWRPLIGIPISYGDVLCILYDEMEYDKVTYFAKSLSTQIKDDYMLFTGVNKYDVATASAKVGAILREDYRIESLKQAVEEDLKIKDAPFLKDGFYKDGSNIFHTNVAYSGTYGILGYQYCVNSLKVLKDSKWVPSADNIKAFLAELTDNAFIPLVRNGNVMSMVNGRAITRLNIEKNNGYVICSAIVDIANLLGEPYKTKYYSLVKSWLEADSTGWWKTRSTITKDVRDLMADPNIKATKPIVMNKIYRYMDRAVHHREDFAFGLSMSSKRILRYEQMNENLKGWFTGSGMTYFYDDDDRQYDGNYFFIADMYRLPGVTAINVPMPVERFKAESVATNDYAGGVSIDNLYGVAGMEADQWNTDLKARKSYFMFDDEVVMVGSSITNTIGRGNTETTIDQKLLLENQRDDISINGSSLGTALMGEKKFDNVNTAHIVGRTKNSKYGYYFPTPTSVAVKKELAERKGSESTKTTSMLNMDFKGTIGTIFMDHGKSPKDAKYEYAVLPNKTVEETENYSKAPDFTVLANENNFHCVKENKLNVTALNNFESSTVFAGGITVSQKSSSILKEDNETISFAISDPTMLVDDKINVALDRTAKSVISSSDRIKVISLSPKIELEVDVKGTNGEGLLIKFSLTGNVELPTGDSKYNDVKGHWAENDIFQMENNLKDVFNEKSLYPDQPITRAEFAGIVCNFLKLEAKKYDNQFVDVNPTDWYAKYVATVYSEKIMEGYDNRFRPEEHISREEMCKVISIIIKADKLDDNSSINKFVDANSISPWAKEYVSICVNKELVKGKENNNFAPHHTTTRAESIALINRINSLI